MMIELKNINLKYEDKDIFKDFTYRINKNEKILLDGESGTGKTTFLKLLCGFVKPDSGKIIYNTQELNNKNINDIRQNIAYISQDVDLPELKVKEFLSEVFSYKLNKKLKYSENVFLDYMKKFNLDKKTIDKNISDLSGGERQRLGIVTALALDRKILLLDEVTSGLEEKLKLTLIECLLGLKKTLIVVSHDSHWKNFQMKSLRW